VQPSLLRDWSHAMLFGVTQSATSAATFSNATIELFYFLFILQKYTIRFKI
jgi:hypothetical protein